MHGVGDARVTEAVMAALAEGPRDVLELLAHLRRALPAVLARQEGAIHAWLQGSFRAGTVHIAGRSERGLTLYGAAVPDAGTTPNAVAPKGGGAGKHAPSETAQEGADKATTRRALQVVRSVRDEADRGRIFTDVAAHLDYLRHAEAGRQFGPLRLARTMLHRTDRGRGTVCFAAGLRDRAHRFTRHEGPWVLGAIVAFLVLRQFVVEVYVIPSESMRTSLEVGDRVVVSKHGKPERWRIFVFEGEGKSIVKRIVALGGESIAVFQGDVYIDGTLAVKPEDVRAALRRRGPRWQADGGTLVDWDRQMAHGEATWTPRNWPASGDHWFQHGPPVRRTPRIDLFDAYVDFTVDRPAGGRASIRLSRGLLNTPGYEGAVEWSIAIHDMPTGDELVIEERRSGAAKSEALLRMPAPPPGEVTLSLAYVDGVLHARTGKVILTSPRPAPYHPLQVRLSTAEGTAPILVALDKDLHYSHDGELGVPGQAASPLEPRPFTVPEDHVFFLGDNTRDSQDSRFQIVGPIPHDRLVGPVVFRILPPSRFGRVR